MFRGTAVPLSRSVSRLDIFGSVPVEEHDSESSWDTPSSGSIPLQSSIGAPEVTQETRETQSLSMHRAESMPTVGFAKQKGSKPILEFPGSSRNKVGFWPQLFDTFGSQLLMLLFVSQHVIKGSANVMVYTAKPFLFRSYGVQAPAAQVYNSILLTPLMLRPVIGLCSDVFPICGYNKAPYIFIAGVLGAGAAFVLGITDTVDLTEHQAVVSLFLIFFEIAVVDLLTEAKYAESVRRHPSLGPSIAAFVWGGLELFTFLGVLVCGYLVQSFDVRVVFMFAFPLLAAIFAPVSMGYLQEKEQEYVDVAKLRRRFWAQAEIPFLCVIMLAGAVVIFYLGMTGAGVKTTFLASLITAVVILLGSAFLLSPEVAKFTIFILLSQGLSIRIRGAAFYFFTDTEDQYPGGPHFSDFFFSSVMGCCAALCSLLAVLAYLRWLSDWRSRRVVLMMGIIGPSLHFLDAIQFSRLNVAWGIPDHLFVLGATSLETATGMWMWMPLMVAFAHECPKGIEATMFALLSGCKYMGGILCDAAGALLLEYLEVRPSGDIAEEDQFKNLGLAATICAIIPLVTIVPLCFLLPDTRQDEGFSGCSKPTNDGTYGSVWRNYSSSDIAITSNHQRAPRAPL